MQQRPPSPHSNHPGTRQVETKTKWVDTAGEPERRYTRRQPATAVTALATGQVTDYTAHGPGAIPSSLYPSLIQRPLLKPQSSRQSPSPSLAFSIPEYTHYISHSYKDQARPNNKDGQMDAWMDRVTGFQHLQKADSQAPMPGVLPNQRLHVIEALVGRPAACKVPQDIPGVSPAL